jgi:AcrR family transcriptional regulator
VGAAFALILDGKGSPSAEDVAERAGVSVSSIFRNFDGLADLQHQAFQSFARQYAHLLANPTPAGDLATRTSAFVRARLELYEQAGPLMALGRVRAFDDDRFRAHLVEHRAALSAQVRACFGPEVDRHTPVEAANLVALIDSLTSPEAFDVCVKFHARSRHHLTRLWTQAVETLVSARATAGRTTSTNGAAS